MLLEAGEFVMMFRSGFCDITAPGLVTTFCDKRHISFALDNLDFATMMIHKLTPGCLD